MKLVYRFKFKTNERFDFVTVFEKRPPNFLAVYRDVMTIGKFMSYQTELDLIFEARQKEYSLSLPMVVCLVLGFMSNFIVPLLVPIFGILAFAIFYKRRISIARLPCPRCNEPFGTKSYIILGGSPPECENCHLSLDGDKA